MMDAIAANYALALLAPLKRNKEGISENSGHKTTLDLVDLLKAKQAEINQLQSQINEMAEVGLSQESAIREKDKRINQALNFINNWWHPDLDQKLFVEALGRALRGERE